MALSTRLTDTGLEVRSQLANIGKVFDTNGEAFVSVWIGTQAEYDALSPDANTIYMITEVV